jgi:hypothetical protein
MATQIVMDHTGDTRHQFDRLEGRRCAERRFKALTGAGFIAAIESRAFRRRYGAPAAGEARERRTRK